MRIRKINDVADILMPNEKRPIGNTFTVEGIVFEFVPIYYMRGHNGPQKACNGKSVSPFGDELPQDYFINSWCEYMKYRLYVSPERDQVYQRVELIRGHKEKQDLINTLLPKIEFIILSAVYEKEE